MGLVFDGNLENISDIQLNYIRDVLENRGFRNTNVSIEVVGKAGDNYVANVKRVTVEGENGVFKLIAKLASQNKTLRNSTKMEALFKNEHLMYTEILPRFLQLQINADVPEDERLRFADCYGTLSEAPHEVILLEDLNESKFMMLNRFQAMSDECVRSVLRNFAIFHSLSFVLKNKEPETFKEIKSELFDMWARIDKLADAHQYFSQIETQAVMMLENERHKRVVKGAITVALSLATKLAKSESNSKHSIIQQGDSWTNNIMFKFDGERLLESIMIDYQLSKESSPACDVLYMIFNCTDHTSRLQYYHDWVDFYHSELDKSLSNFGLKASFLYPRDQLDADMKRHGKMMFGISLILASVNTMKSDDASKMKEAMESANIMDMVDNYNKSNLDKEHTKIFIKRVEDLIDSYLAFGLL